MGNVGIRAAAGLRDRASRDDQNISDMREKRFAFNKTCLLSNLAELSAGTARIGSAMLECAIKIKINYEKKRCWKIMGLRGSSFARR